MRRIIQWCRHLVLWLMALAPGLLVIAYGTNGILDKRLQAAGRFRSFHDVSYGKDAVGWGWLFVGIGFWALGQCCYLKTSRPFVKLVGWALAVVAAMIGVWVLMGGLNQGSG